MTRTDTTAYPWHSDTVYAAELDSAGLILRANPAMRALGGEPPLDGERFETLLSPPQQPAFRELLTEVGADWTQAIFGMLDRGGDGAADRRLWLRRTAEDTIELIAEPAWDERDRLVGEVLTLNDDLIATRRSVARRQRELELARQRASEAVDRTRRLEAILMAGLAPGGFDDALRSLMRTAEGMMPGNRADLLLLNDDDELEMRASVGEASLGTERGRSAAVQARSAVAQPLLERIARTGESVLVSDLAASATALPESADTGSLIGVPLSIDGRVVGVLAARAAGSDSFSDVDLRLLEVVGERISLAIGHAGLRVREQRLAETLQRSLLPQQLPTVTGFEVAARYDAHTAEVGGDFYDVLDLGHGRIGVAIGDVTGKGLRAAAAMGRMRGGLYAYAIEDAPPAVVMSRLGRLAESGGELATAQYVIIDASDGRAELASAGHLPPLLLEDGQARYLEVAGAQSAALGLSEPDRTSGRFELATGAMLILYTDGLVEQQRDAVAGMRDLAAAVERLHDAPADLVCTRLLEELAPQGRHRDDVAILVVRRQA